MVSKMEYYDLYLKQQSGTDTDCSFVFKCDEELSKKIIHAHKLILSTISPYFEVNFKEEWKGNQAISVTTVSYSIFEKLIRAIYLNEVSFESLDEASALYEAAHFYMMEKILDLLRVQIPKYLSEIGSTTVSRLFNVVWKHQDVILMHVISKYFVEYACILIKNADFYNFSPHLVNYLYQFDNLNAQELELHGALEMYVKNNESISVKELKAAIGALRFIDLGDIVIKNTLLLSDVEKYSLLGKNELQFLYLSKNYRREPYRNARTPRIPAKLYL